jgi:uncharacterized protein YqgC (DUF456 family)
MVTSLLVFLLVTLLLSALMAGWALTVLGMPGNWLIVGVTAVYVAMLPAHSGAAIGWPVVFVLFGLAALGELLEFMAGALGVVRMGGSRRASLLGLVGSLVGAMVGLFVGLPIPLFGSLAGAVVLASLGALIGALVGEITHGRTVLQSWQVGRAAFWGRLLGSLAKILIASVMVALGLAALVL